MTEPSGLATRYVVLHIPGPSWNPDCPPTEQPGVMDHFAYLQGVAQQGKIEMSGPFLREGAGGMILLADGIGADEAERIGTEDPGVKSGLIRYEVRPWMITIRGS